MHPYKDVLVQSYFEGFNQVHSRFMREAEAPGKAQGLLKHIIPNYKAMRQKMDKQLLKNICTIIIENLDNPKVVGYFFNEYIIFPAKKK